ncbi:hypothetical protein C8N35_104218 [Breoghania corrubedonensis]|uniref:Uncharacterized protein n=1 Tax=Breoghania corrubedonensis TaxID=665038 RepID=A0A2T5VA10_9HYPH|nr:DUF6634 family protein [Breoghania corrubedonensis]PTW60593.1 hypothetical protein C8N35_104218 [Breoghania corrubedonensis]
MIPFDMNGQFDREKLSREIDNLKRLVSDLERIRDGIYPDARTLRSSPALNDWRLTFRHTPALSGSVRDHPRLPDADEIITSEVHIIAPALGLARTRSRWYRLEQRAAKRI